MRVVTILGSPKSNGNTAHALDMLETNLALQGHEVERIHAAARKINGCTGCNACIHDKEGPDCVQEDDAMSCFETMISADVLVYAFPLYAFSFPAQMKSLIDRHYCLVTNAGLPNQSSVLEGKRVALLVTCSDPVENNADIIQTAFDRIFLDRLRCSIVGKYVVASSAAPDFDQRASEMAKIIAGEIAGSHALS